MMSDIIRTSYYYADGQRIAMKKNGVVSCIYGDQLESVSAVADADGNLISKTLYHPWGTTRYAQGTSPTDYGYTGQMKEGDIYFYNARWYDPQLGRFMQADTIVPTVQGTQGFDRYAYVNNSPMKYTDPSGYRAYDDYYGRGCKVIDNNNKSYLYDGKKAASVMGQGYTPYEGSQCTTAVSTSVNFGGIPVSKIWYNSVNSLAWYRTHDNFNYWVATLGYDFFESSDLPAVYNPSDLSQRESIYTSKGLHDEIASISSKIEIGDLVYYMDPYNYSIDGKPVYTHVDMIVDIATGIDGEIVPYIMEVDGPIEGYKRKCIVVTTFNL